MYFVSFNIFIYVDHHDCPLVRYQSKTYARCNDGVSSIYELVCLDLFVDVCCVKPEQLFIFQTCFLNFSKYLYVTCVESVALRHVCRVTWFACVVCVTSFASRHLCHMTCVTWHGNGAFKVLELHVIYFIYFNY